MDIPAATTLAAGIIALVAPALVQAFKKYIPADYVGLTSLGVSILLGTLAIAATNGFHGYGWGIRPHRRRRCRPGRLHARQPSVRRQAEQGYGILKYGVGQPINELVPPIGLMR